MATVQTESLATLYDQDETAWLEIMADLVARKQYAELDHKNTNEPEMKLGRFPKTCAWDVDDLLRDD